MNIRKIHYLSGITLTVFIGIHLFNHFMGIIGPEAHIEWMDKLRVVYRNRIVESILLLAVIVQIYSGIRLFLETRKRKSKFYQKIQIWSGLYLAVFLLIHVGAVMAGRFILGVDTNFYFGVAGLNTFPMSIFFLPYYSLAIMAFFGHIASIHAMKMRKEVLGLSVVKQSNLLLILGVLISLIIMYSLTNGFTGVEIPAAYNVLIGK